MQRYVITKERLIKLTQKINSGSAPGVYDWFVEDDGRLNVLLNVSGVNYIYREIVSNNNVAFELGLSRNNEILGVVDDELEEEEPLREITLEEIFGGGV